MPRLGKSLPKGKLPKLSTSPKATIAKPAKMPKLFKCGGRVNKK